MQPALGNDKRIAKVRHCTGVNKGSERKKAGSDEEINRNSSSWEDTDSDQALQIMHVQKKQKS